MPTGSRPVTTEAVERRGGRQRTAAPLNIRGNKEYESIYGNYAQYPFYPGAGYLYLRDPECKTIAKFLVGVWTIFIGAVLYELIKAIITGNFSPFTGEMRIPALAVIMWVGMSIDTFFLAKGSK